MFDSHCHIHDSEFYDDATRRAVYERAREKDVDMLLIGTSVTSSREAVEFAASHDGTWATVGVHPHDADDGVRGIEQLLELHAADLAAAKIVGIGEIGLDYFYENSQRATQRTALKQQLELAARYNLPVSFHVRGARNSADTSVWDDFWPIFDAFSGIRGVLHSFTDTQAQLDVALARGLFIGVNGIATFAPSRDPVNAKIPLESLLLETDAPFLTPKPFRGTINEPMHVERVAEHMAALYGVPPGHVMSVTRRSAEHLFLQI